MKLKNYSSFLIIIFLLCHTSLSAQEIPKKQNEQLDTFSQFMGIAARPYNLMVPRLPGFGNFLKVKGDVLITGNQILNRTTESTAGTNSGDVVPTLNASGQPTNLAALTTRANTNYNGGLANDRLNFEYIDIDGDNTTFSSSTANLEIRDLTNNTPGTFCKKIVYAGLYWSAYYPFDRINATYNSNSGFISSVKYPRVNTNFNQVKFKVPLGTYQTLTADASADLAGEEDEIIFSGFTYPGSDENANSQMYVCYKNVTNLLKSLTDANGTYAVADMLATRGNDREGLVGGWSLVVVFESPSYPLKYVSVVDGAKLLYNDTGGTPPNNEFGYTFSGFKTLPTGPINARVGGAALEGDRPTNNDYYKNDVFEVRNKAGNFVNLSNDLNRAQPDYPDNNFFQSTITRPNNFPSKNAINISRSPNCSNTLGFDLDIVNVDNISKSILDNTSTSLEVRMRTTGDSFSPYLSTFSVDIADAKVILTKVIKNTSGTLIANGAALALGQQFNYVIGFQNIGTDDATNVTIADVLPANVVFDQAILTASLPAGVTLTSYNAVTRTLTFAIANSLVEKNDFRTEFNIEVIVEKDCTKYEGPCSNIISNTARMTYTSNGIVTNLNSANVETTAGCILEPTPSPTVFNVNTSTCTFTKTAVMCTGNLTLTAPSGYASYVWTRLTPSVLTLGTNATQTVNSAQTFSVLCTPISGCTPITVLFKVFDFTDNTIPIPNPVAPFADSKINCGNFPSNSQEVIALCGSNDSRLIATGITTANSIKWQRNTGGCLGNASCPDSSDSCYTDIVGTANNPNFLADTAGDYRLVIRYDGAASCTQTFYFKVTKGNVNATATNTDILCNTAGTITITSPVAANYEYQLQGPFPATTLTAWQTSPNFNIAVANPGTYTAFIRVNPAAPNSCVYKVPNISVLKKTLESVITVTQPNCFGETGSVQVQAQQNSTPLIYTIRSGNETGPVVQTINNSFNTQETFTGLGAGNYTARIDQSGCFTFKSFTISVPTQLTATAGVNKPFTFCNPGEIVVTAGGGTSGYLYSIDNTGVFQASNIFAINDSNAHTFKVKDSRECVVTSLPFTMPFAAAPTFTVTPTNIVCDPQSGALNFTTLTNPGGFTFAYEYSGGCFRSPVYTSSNSPTIPNLVGDSYLVRVKCTLGTAVCYTPVQTVVITTQFQPLSATGGVSALAGCFNTTAGEIRITNPQGGSTNYSYSFDNDVTYQTLNFITKEPGTYQTYIRDNVTQCKFKMEVILLPKPTPPTFAVTNTSFNCNGTSTGTVTITNGPNFAYQYFINNNDNLGFVPNPNTAQPNVFLNVPCATLDKQIRIDYRSTNIPTFSNLLFEDFGTGSNTKLPNNTIAAAYCYNDQCSRACNNTTDPNDPYRDRLEDGQYVVTRAIIPNNGAWWPARDHTSNGTNPNGRFLAINIGAAAGNNGVLYSKRIYDVIPNQDIIVEAYVSNLIKIGVGAGVVDPGFTYEITTSTGVPLASLPASPDLLPRTDSWLLRTVNLNPGNVVTPYLIFNVRSASVLYNGNDAIIDDIKVYQIPRACVTTETFPLNVPCDKIFTAKVDNVKNVDCFGTNTAAITISAENFVSATSIPPNNSFEYSLTGGTPPWYSSTVSPVVISATSTPSLPLGAGPYNIVVRFNSTVTGCSVPLTGTITQPTQLSVTAIKTNATCATNSRGTITATGLGGSPAYQYQLLNSSLAVVAGFGYGSPNINNGTGLFTGVLPGIYFVQIRDSNLCIQSSLASVTIADVDTPDVNINSLPIKCYNPINPPSITVSGSNGQPPYSFTVSPPVVPFIGNNITLPPGGPYIITVTDRNGCKGFITTSVPFALSAVVSLIKDYDCSASPAAVIRVSISGGNPGYTYQVSTDNGINYGTSSPVPSNPFDFPVTVAGVPISGAIKIKIIDSEGCTFISQTINISPRVDVLGTATPTIATCGNNNGSVILQATAGAPAFTYSFNNSAFTATTSYPLLAPATYPYKIKDSKGCEFASTVTVGASGTITGAANFSAYTCDANSIITFTGMPANSVALGYLYSVDGGANFQPNPVFNNGGAGYTAGTFVCIIKDINNCPKPAGILIIPPLNKPTNITFVETIPASCTTVPTLTATVQLTATATNSIIKYEITAPASAITNITGATSGLFSGLLAGTTYSFLVTDNKNCTFSKDYTIITPNTISVAGTKTNVKCKGDSNGTLTYTVSNFLPGTYSYVVTNVTAGTTIVPLQTLQTATTINNVILNALAAGTYKIVVTSTQTGCTDTIDLIIAEPAIALTASNTPTAISCSASGNIGAQVQLNGINGGSPYTYTLLSPTNTPIAGTNGLFTGLTAVGTYTGSVTDNFGCTLQTTFTLVSPVEPFVTLNQTTLCFNGSTADVVINVTGGLAPYQYNLDNAGFPALTYNNITLDGLNNFTLPLSQGSHTIIIRGANGCIFTIPAFTIQPQLSLQTTFKDTDCSTNPTANINGTITGGTAPYRYQTSTNGGTTFLPALPTATAVTVNPFTFLPPTPTGAAVTYIVRAIDVNNCVADSLPITINPIVAVTGSNVPPTDATCGAANGTVTITAGAGTPPFTYRFDGVFPFTYTSTNVYSGAAGPHTYQVRDAKGCTSITYNVTIGSPGAVTGTVSSVDLTCDAGTGIITFATPTAGTGPFTYSITGTSGTFVATNVFGNPTPLTPGTYVCVVKDAFDCTYTLDTKTINPINPPIEIGFTQSNSICTPTGNSATVTLAATFTNSIVKYETISPSVANIDNGTSNVFNNLASGLYTYQITDSKNCKIQRTFVVTPPVQIAVSGQLISNVKCRGDATGAIRYNVSSFAPNYSYTVTSPVLATPFTGAGIIIGVLDFPNLLAGTYTITVTSSTGCTATDFVEVTQAAVALTATPTFTPLPCPVGTASITVNAGGGIGSYTYVLDRPSPQPNITQTSPNNVFTGLTLAGLYTITITDAAGCVITRDVTITAPVSPTVSVNENTFCVTAGLANVEATIVGVNPPFEYSLDNGTFVTVTANPFTVNVAPSAAPHTIRVKDNLQCVSFATSFTINPAITVTTTLTNAKCDLAGNEVAAVISGTVGNGYPNYGYQVYYSATLPVLPLPAATVFLPAIPIALGAGITNYTYAATSGTAFGAGYYVIRFTDANDCKVDSNLINVTPLIPITEATPIVTNVICNGDATGAITIVPQGGKAPYEVDFNGAGVFSSNLSYSGLTAANPLLTGTTYSYVIRDANGCLKNGSATVMNLYEKILATAVITPLSCGGGTIPIDGKICLTSITGGLPPYQITATNSSGDSFGPIFSATGIPTAVPGDMCFDNLEFGFYYFTIVDNNGTGCSVNLTPLYVSNTPTGLITAQVPPGPVDCSTGGCLQIKVDGSALALSPTASFFFAINNVDPYPAYFVGSPFYLPATNPIPLTPPGVRDPLHEEITFCGLTRGLTYNFVVYSTENNCYYPAQATVPVGSLSQIETTSTVKNISCLSNPTNDASVSFTFTKTDATSVLYEIYYAATYLPTGISGTVGPLSGLLTTINSVNDLSLLGLPVGTYYIQFTETGGSFSGCKTTSPLFTINAPSAALVLQTPTKTDANCNPLSGTVTAVASGGSGGFQYQIFTAAAAALLPTYNPSNPAYIAFLNSFTSNTSTFNVNANTAINPNYVVYVKDATGCLQSQPVTVGLTPNPQVTLVPVTDQCLYDGSIYTFTATASDGVAPYSFSINGIVQGTSATAGTAVPITVNNSGTYVVTVTDFNGCTGTASVTIYPPISVSAVEVLATVCPLNDAGQAQATATGGSGSYVYSISLGGTINSSTGLATGLTAGVTYIITATDALTPFCPKTTDIKLIPAQPVVFSLDQTSVSCNDNANGNNNANGTITVTLDPTMNPGSYSYQITNGPPGYVVVPAIFSNVSPYVFTGLQTGLYEVTVISAKFCPAVLTITVGTQPLVTAALQLGTPAPFNCTTNTTTSITINAGGGVGGYTYSIDGINYLTTNIFNDIPDTGTILLPQVINYYVKDANGCIATNSVTLTRLNKVTATVALNGAALTCLAGEQVIVNATNGSGNYEYELLGSGIPAGASNLFLLTNAGTTPKTYTFEVTDLNSGCSTLASYIVSPLPVLGVTISSSPAITCGGGTSQLTFAVTNYSGTYNFDVIQNGTTVVQTGSGTTSVVQPAITGLIAGNYTVKVTETQAPFCDKTSNNVFITQPDPLQLNPVTNIAQNCPPSGAVVTVSALGGTPGYTYAFVVAGSPAPTLATQFQIENFESLNFATSTTWDVYVRDNLGCIIAIPLTVTITKTPDPTITLPAQVTNQCDLLATSLVFSPPVVGSDGLGPLTYSIDGVNFFPAIPNIPFPTVITTVTVTVKDANGCIATDNVIVYPKLGIDTDIIRQPTCVPLNDGQIKVIASGGSGNFVTPPIISPSAGTFNPVTNTFSGLTFNVDYTITVTDAITNCTIISDIIRLTEPLNPTFNVIPTIVKCNINGIPSVDGTIKVTLTGTNIDSPYTYQLSGGPTVVAPFVTNALTHEFTGLATGTYTVRVTSNLGCFDEQFNVFVGAPQAFTATAAATAFLCDTSNTPQTATITITPQLAGLPVLPAGYTFSLNGVGGTFGSENTFQIIDNGSTQSFSNLSVKDANGCVTVVAPAIDINSLPKILSATVALSTLVSDPRLACDKGENVVITVLPANATDYRYRLLPTGLQQASNAFTLLSDGNYTFEITNIQTLCTFQTTYDVLALPILGVQIIATPVIDCNGGTSQLTFAVSNYSGTYDYEVFLAPNAAPIRTVTGVNTSAGNINVLGLLAGNYTIKVTETQAPRCNKTSTSASLVQPASAVVLTLISNTLANCNVGAIVTVSASGGNTLGGYTYAFVQNGVIPIAANYTASAQAILDPTINLDWDVYAIDSKGCPSNKLDVTIARTPNPVITSFGLLADNKCDATATFYSYASSINATGFTTSTSPLTYSLTGAAPFYTLADLPLVPVPTTGSVVYQLTVKDANGCTATSIVGTQSLTVYPHISSTSTITTFTSCELVAGIPTGVVTLGPSGGSGSLVVSMTTPPATATIVGNVISGLPAGTHEFTITDTVTDCKKTVTVIMPSPTAVTLAPFAKTDVTCDGGTDGTITINLSTLTGANPNPVYQYALFLSSNLLIPIRPNQTNYTFIGLAEGIYTVVVTSGIGCKAQQIVTINDPDIIVVNLPIITQFGCTTTNTGNQASILVNSVVGGSGVYTVYEFINTATGLPVRTPDSNNLLNIANLEGGTYTVKVFDDKGCSGTSLSITIAPFIKIDVATVTIDRPIRCNNLTEKIIVSQTVIFPFGVPNVPPIIDYTIVGISGTIYPATTNNSGIFDLLPIGKYTITIKNTATNCFLTINHFVNDPNVYQVIIENIVAVKCNGGSTGSATIRMVNGALSQPIPNENLPVVAAPFSYIIRNNAGGGIVASGNSTTTNATGATIINNLPFGNYTAELTLTSDPFMCKSSFIFSISQPAEPLDVRATANNGGLVTCKTPKEGSIDILVSGGTPFTNGINAPYTITLLNTLGQSFAGNATNLEAGTYQVIVTDANGCEDKSKFVTLSDPPAIVANITPLTQTLDCIGDDGTITINSIIGGQGSIYTTTVFVVVPGEGDSKLGGPVLSTVGTFFNLGAGEYKFLIEDGYGCSTLYSGFIILNPSLIAPTLVTFRNESCLLPQQLALDATGGTGPYTYSSDGGATFSAATFTSGSPIIFTVAPNTTYNYVVRDSILCTQPITIKTPPTPARITLLSKTQTNIICFGSSDGSIKVSAQGGFSVDYTYSIATTSIATGPVVSLATNTTGLFENLNFGANLGVYYITVVSTNSCPVDFPFTLLQPKEFIVIPDPVDVNCFGDNDGKIILEIENATGNLQYAISTLTNSTGANQFINFSGPVIQLSAPGVIPVRTGIRFTISGLAPDSYLLQVNNVFNGLASCPYRTLISNPIVIDQPFELNSNLKANSSIQERCKNDKDASFSITITGGTAPYFVSLDNNGTGTYVPANVTIVGSPFGHDFTLLEGGTHKVYVKDSNGCMILPYDVILDLPVFLNPEVKVTYPCPEDEPSIKNRILITVDPSINLADVTFSIDGSTFPSNDPLGFKAENLTVGTHIFEVIHKNGCRQPKVPNNKFEIRFIDPLSLKLTDGNLNQIIAIAAGGDAPYNYSFNGVSTGQDNTYIYDKSGNYSVTIVDTSNCKLTVTKPFNFIDIFIPNFFSPNGDGENDGWSPQNTFNYKNLVFYVFDRYGRKIVSLKEGQQWDGKYEGAELPTGDYWYIVKTEESSSREFVGNFTLYR